MLFWAFLLLLILSVPSSLFFDSIEAAIQFKSLQKERAKIAADKKGPKQVAYDKDGILSIDGAVPGISDPILVDQKPLLNYCGIRPYYAFRICLKDKEMLAVCREGITFCYEGQMNELNVQDHFVLPTSPKNKVSEKCKEFNAFKIAIHHLPWMKDESSQKHLFIEIRTSYMHESYFFPMPDFQCLDLLLGNADNLLTSVRTEDGDIISPQQVHLEKNGSVTGFGYAAERGTDNPFANVRKQFYEDFSSLPDRMRMEKFSDAPHLKMLYLDFRAQYLVPQMMIVVVPESECNMLVTVTGNTIEQCKSKFKQKNYALRSFKDNRTSTTYGLTFESGIEDFKTVGSKSKTGKSRSSEQERANSQTDEYSSTTGLQRQNEHVESFNGANMEESGDSNTFQIGGHWSGKFGIGKGGLKAMGGPDAFLQYGLNSGFTDKSNRQNSRLNFQSSYDSSIVTKSSILERAYRSTTTSINTQQKSLIKSKTVGVTKRTIFKWIVKVPPGKLVTPMQMQMNCDGESVKIPWITFLLTEEGQPLPVNDY